MSWCAVQIDQSTSLSSAVDIKGQIIVGFEMPASWTAADLTFQAARLEAGDEVTYRNLYHSDADGTDAEVTIGAGSDRFIGVDNPAVFGPVDYVKVRSGTAAAAVNQGADRTIYVYTVPVGG